MRIAAVAAHFILGCPLRAAATSRLARRRRSRFACERRLHRARVEAGFRPEKSSGGQAATPNDSGPQANVIGRLLKIELDPAKSECCIATSAVQ